MSTISYGILGSSTNPVATAELEWIVCPANHEYIGTVRVTNLDFISVTFRIAHTPTSGAAAIADWIVYDAVLAVGDFMDITVEMGAGETLRIYASTANLTFHFTGQDKDNS